MRVRALLPLLLPLLLLPAIAVAGCGGSGSSSTIATTTGATAAGASTSAASAAPVTRGTVQIVSFKYRPATVVVRSGGSVAFDNRDTASHTATADDGAFDSGTLAIGARKQVTFARAGTYAYHCDFHPFMHGTVVVK